MAAVQAVDVVADAVVDQAEVLDLEASVAAEEDAVVRAACLRIRAPGASTT